MTKEELAQAEARIAAARAAMRRVDCLTSAIEKLKTGTVQAIVLPVEDAWSFFYTEGSMPASRCQWERVCFADSEDGLAAEVLEAVRGVLARRRATAAQILEAI